MITTKFKSVTKWMVCLGATLFIAACSSNYDGSYAEEVPVESTNIGVEYKALEDGIESLSGNELKSPKIPAELKIIKSASTRYKVKNVKLSTEQVKKIATHYNAYISDLRYENTLYRIENRFTIKVPQEHFDAILDSIGAVADFIEYENITSEDVSEEYIDLQARLKTKLDVQKRYEEILRSNAKTVKEILATEEKLRLIQEEIESAQGRLNYLSSRVAYSTIQVDLYETVEYTEKPTEFKKSFWEKSKGGFSFGWKMIEKVVLFFVHIWPITLVLIGFFIWIRKKIK